MIEDDFSLNTLVQSIIQQLKIKYLDEILCNQYAWWILESITQQKKSTLILRKTIALSPKQKNMLDYWIKKLVDDNIPLQYLIGSVPFISCEILVEPPTLIPRQETEEWCANLSEKFKKISDTSLRILDLCTGSGCIAVSLAKVLPHAEIYASDISHSALSLAAKNANYNKVSNITFISSDLFQDLPKNILFDIIISNPPYISENEWHHVDPSVKEWEDNNALLAADEGLAILKQVIHQAHNYLRPNELLQKNNIPQLIIEIGYKQGDIVAQLFKKEGFCNIIVQKDMQDKDRLVMGYLDNEKTERL